MSASRATRRGWIDADAGVVSIVRQCAVAGLTRSTSYYEPVPDRPENLVLMRLLDALYPQRPFYGVPRLPDWRQTLGHAVNHKRVARRMRVMGLQAVVEHAGGADEEAWYRASRPRVLYPSLQRRGDSEDSSPL